MLNVDKRERELQVATDAFALRHHVAESLVRLYHGLAVATGRCTWARISEGPYKAGTLVKECRTHVFSEAGHAQFWSLILPVSVAVEPVSERSSLQLNVAADWLRYAMRVLERDDINLGTAHNRMKHGFAGRANDDLLMTLTAQAPAPDGSMPLSALTEPQGSDIVAGPTLHYLSRARVAKRDQGWEFNTVNLHPHLRLAEASMMITTLSAIFHLAAERHFDGRAPLLPPYPDLPTGPTPDQLLAGTVIGLRQAITDPPDGEPTDRPTGLARHEGFLDVTIDFANATTGIVVDG